MLSALVRASPTARYAMNDAFREREGHLFCTIEKALEEISAEALAHMTASCQQQCPNSPVFAIAGSLARTLVAAIVCGNYGEVGDLCYVLRQTTEDELRFADLPVLGKMHLAIKVGGLASNYKLVGPKGLALARVPVAPGDAIVYPAHYSLALGMVGAPSWILVVGFLKPPPSV